MIGLNISIEIFQSNINILNDKEKIDNICEECQNIDESVSQNLILSGYKLCKSCRISKESYRISKGNLKNPIGILQESYRNPGGIR